MYVVLALRLMQPLREAWGQEGRHEPGLAVTSL